MRDFTLFTVYSLPDLVETHRLRITTHEGRFLPREENVGRHDDHRHLFLPICDCIITRVSRQTGCTPLHNFSKNTTANILASPPALFGVPTKVSKAQFFYFLFYLFKQPVTSLPFSSCLTWLIIPWPAVRGTFLGRVF